MQSLLCLPPNPDSVSQAIKSTSSVINMDTMYMPNKN